jgi:hypothetical protein
MTLSTGDLVLKLVRSYLDVHARTAPEDVIPALKSVLTQRCLEGILPVLEAGDCDPLFGVQDVPEEWGERMAAIVQEEGQGAVRALVLFGPPPALPALYTVSIQRDRLGRWHIDRFVPEGVA